MITSCCANSTMSRTRLSIWYPSGRSEKNLASRCGVRSWAIVAAKRPTRAAAIASAFRSVAKIFSSRWRVPAASSASMKAMASE
jgi:hypothetical protein